MTVSALINHFSTLALKKIKAIVIKNSNNDPVWMTTTGINENLEELSKMDMEVEDWDITAVTFYIYVK